jgi:hypothetical protein
LRDRRDALLHRRVRHRRITLLRAGSVAVHRQLHEEIDAHDEGHGADRDSDREFARVGVDVVLDRVVVLVMRVGHGLSSGERAIILKLP